MLRPDFCILGWKSSRTCGLIWNQWQRPTTSNGRLALFYFAEISFSLRRYKPFLFKSYNTVSQHFKKILEKVTQEPNVVKALTKTSVSMELDDVDDMFQQFGDAMQVLIKLFVSFIASLLDPNTLG